MQYEYISTTDWYGCDRINFRLNGRESLVVRPKKPLPGNPTAWRTEFFGAFDSVDRALLERGWHLCYHRVSDMYGCPQSVAWMHEFYEFVSQTFGLAKPVLFGFSRGGLYAVNYAAAYPSEIAGLYLDAPVCDIRSWPCRIKTAVETIDCLHWYRLTFETLPDFAGNPIDKLQSLRDANLPIIIVAGDSDQSVPYENNGAVLVERYRALGGVIETIIKPGCGHHPHSLDDPSPVVKFIEEKCI
ncbi:MAG: alpha/beta hydrolase [Clostridia bacterium]|nr:alpha/beta hydrolase [Clostridia bacterium]